MGGSNVASTYVDFVVTGDPASARATVEQALAGRRFRMSWHDDWTGFAERGSKVAYMLVGALAQYFKVGVRLMAVTPGETIVRIERQSSGLMGGAIGTARTTKNMASLRSELEATFVAAGVLRSVNEV
jgi:hypothetical protein